MKKAFFVFFVAFTVSMFMSQASWAMGRVKHHSQSDFASNTNHSPHITTQSQTDVPITYDQPVVDVTNGDSSHSAAVPEPVTLSLMGAGFIAYCLRQRTRAC